MIVRQVNVFELDMLIFPQWWPSHGGHWFCIAVDFRRKFINIYDSFVDERRVKAVYRVRIQVPLRECPRG